MSRIRELFVQGDRLFDQSDFEGAIKAYQEALFLEEDSEQARFDKEDILSNLHQARRMALLSLLERLLAKFPDSTLFQRDRIVWYVGHYHPKSAIQYCDELFAQLDRQGDEWRPYELRMSVERRNGIPTHLAQDFIHIWKKLEKPIAKQRLIEVMLATSDVRLLPAFIELSQHPDLSPHIQTLFKQKAESLQLLQEIFDTELADK